MSKKYKIFLLVSIILFLFSFGVYFFKNTELGRASVSGVINAPVKLTGLSAPTGSNDASTKGYVDAASSKGWNYCYGICVQSNTPASCAAGETKIVDWGYGTGCASTPSFKLYGNGLYFLQDAYSEEVNSVGITSPVASVSCKDNTYWYDSGCSICCQ